MRAAILCPGPSLARTWTSGLAYDVRIAVNRAILHETCHWWSVGDWTTAQDIAGRPTNGIVSQDDTIRFIRGGSLIPADRTPPQLLKWSELPTPNPAYSMIAALGLAAHLGATDVDIYGDDKSGEKDWDGHTAGKNRGDERWARERTVLAKALMGLAVSHNLSVRHVRDDSYRGI